MTAYDLDAARVTAQVAVAVPWGLPDPVRAVTELQVVRPLGPDRVQLAVLLSVGVAPPGGPATVAVKVSVPPLNVGVTVTDGVTGLTCTGGLVPDEFL